MTDNDLPKPDIARLRRVLAKIDAEPETWDQTAYALKHDCGTCYCIAGHVVVDEGHKISFGDFGNTCSTAWFTDDGVRVFDIASKLLGLTEEEAVLMFDAHNDRDDIQRYAERIAERAGEKLWATSRFP